MELTESTAKQELPACPVETTLTLISDKWKVLILRDLMNGTLRFGELKKVHRARHAEGSDRTAAPDGGQRSADAQGLCRGAAACGIHADRTRVQPETRDGRPVEMGEKIIRHSAVNPAFYP